MLQAGQQSDDSVAVMLRSITASDHKPLLAYLEQEAKKDGDLDMLRDIRAYRRRVDPKTSSSS
jgi:hypothetical protein